MFAVIRRSPCLAVLGFLLIANPAPGVAAGSGVTGPAAAELLEATPFTLAEPVSLTAGSPADHHSGLILVLRAEPALVTARQGPMPVAQLGDRVVFPASRGEDGLLVGIVLGDVLGELDPGAAVLFLSPPAMPDAGDPARSRERHAQAIQAGLQPVGAETAAHALGRGGSPLSVRRFEDLAPYLLAIRCRLEPEALTRAGVPCPGGEPSDEPSHEPSPAPGSEAP